MAGVWDSGAPFGTLGSEDTGGDDFWSDGGPEGGLPDVGGATQLDVVALEALTVTDVRKVAVTPMRVTVSDAVGSSDGVEPEPLDGRYVRDAITVVDRVRAGGILRRAVSETISVVEFKDWTGKTAFRFSRREATFVTDVVKAQLYIGGGLWVRVSESVSVAESPFYIGFPPEAGGAGNPDLSQIAIGPNPAATDVDLGEDYWDVGI